MPAATRASRSRATSAGSLVQPSGSVVAQTTPRTKTSTPLTAIAKRSSSRRALMWEKPIRRSRTVSPPTRTCRRRSRGSPWVCGHHRAAPSSAAATSTSCDRRRCQAPSSSRVGSAVSRSPSRVTSTGSGSAARTCSASRAVQPSGAGSTCVRIDTTSARGRARRPASPRMPTGGRTPSQVGMRPSSGVRRHRRLGSGRSELRQRGRGLRGTGVSPKDAIRTAISCGPAVSAPRSMT